MASALAEMGVACWEYHTVTSDLWWSPNAGPMVGRAAGFTPAGLQDAFEITARDETRPGPIEEIVQTLQQGPIEVDRQMLLPDGSPKWIRHRYFLGTDEDGRRTRLLGIMVDVDEQKKRDMEEAALVEAGELLNRSLDVDETLESVAALLVPDLADWCVVHLLDDGHLRSVVTAHVDPSKTEWAKAIQAEYPIDMDSPVGAPKVARTREAEFYPDITDEMLVAVAGGDERKLEVLRQVGYRSAMVVPLITRDQATGTITLVTADSKRRFDSRALAFAGRLAQHIAVALENSRLHTNVLAAWEGQREAVETLQQGLTPEPLPVVEGLTLAAHYEIGGTSKVGGDWYDALDLEKGDVAFVIGDVAGRGVPAVAGMSRYRNGLKMLVLEGDRPARILTALNRFGLYHQQAGDALATAVCMLYDRTTGTLRWSRAGHTFPLLRLPDGGVVQLDHLGGPALGVHPDATYREAMIEVEPGSVLLLYTDGLVERPGEDIHASIDRLASVFSAAPPHIGELPDYLTRQLISPPLRDDVAILAVEFKRTWGDARP